MKTFRNFLSKTTISKLDKVNYLNVINQIYPERLEKLIQFYYPDYYCENCRKGEKIMIISIVLDFNLN